MGHGGTFGLILDVASALIAFAVRRLFHKYQITKTIIVRGIVVMRNTHPSEVSIRGP